MALRSVTQFEIDALIVQAKKSDRKRKILRLHEHHEPVQRMVNALIPGTYIAPHKHENPDKVELFTLLKGAVAILQFSATGGIEVIVKMELSGIDRVIEIPPGTYHSIIPVVPSAVLEIIQGPYNEKTHKQFAPWAPRENDPKSNDYLMYLTSIVHNWSN